MPEEYHWPVMQVLTSFVRSNSPRKRGQSNGLNGLSRDIQSVMNVLATRKWTYMNGEGDKEERLSFFGTDLSGLSMIGEKNHLEGMSFKNANLTNANFRDSHLDNALMNDATLSIPIFTGHI